VSLTTYSATATKVYVAWPEGRRVRRRVKEFADNDAANAERVHPGKAHAWHEMLHFGERGTGFVVCKCGAHGIPYGRSR
jgi:hypothetical protein